MVKIGERLKDKGERKAFGRWRSASGFALRATTRQVAARLEVGGRRFLVGGLRQKKLLATDAHRGTQTKSVGRFAVGGWRFVASASRVEVGGRRFAVGGWRQALRGWRFEAIRGTRDEKRKRN